MQASNSCLITTLPEQLAYKGLVVLLERIAEVRALLNPALELDGIVFTMVKNNSIHREYKELIRQQFSNLKVFESEIKHLIDFQKAMVEHLTISAFNKNSEAANSKFRRRIFTIFTINVINHKGNGKENIGRENG
jgi:chromosome partitioning protein